MHAIAALFIFAPAILCLAYVLITSFLKRLRRRRASQLDPESLRSTSLFLSRLQDPFSFDEPFSRGWLQRYLPVVAYDRRQHASSAPSAASDECPVCLCCFDDGEPVRTLPACRHAFHMDCIDMWLKSHWNCPVCREEIRPLNDPKGKAAPPLSRRTEETVIVPPSESQSIDEVDTAEARGQSPGEVGAAGFPSPLSRRSSPITTLDTQASGAAGFPSPLSRRSSPITTLDTQASRDVIGGAAGIPSPISRRSSPMTTLDTQASRDVIGDVDGEQGGGNRRSNEEGEREPLTLTTNAH